jgi:hypothetical protein
VADVRRFLWKTKLNQWYFNNPWRCNKRRNKNRFSVRMFRGFIYVINYGLFVSKFISWIEEKGRQEWGLGVRFSPGFPPSRCLKISRILHLKGQCLESGIRDCLALQYTTVSPTPTYPSPVHTRLQSVDTIRGHHYWVKGLLRDLYRGKTLYRLHRYR